MSAIDPESNSFESEDLPSLEGLEPTFSAADLGTLILGGIEAEMAPPTTLEKQFRLLDIQARHRQELESSGVLMRAYLQASEIDFRNESAPILPDNTPYQVQVFSRIRAISNGGTQRIAGIRFVTNEPNQTGTVDRRRYDVLVAIEGDPYPPFHQAEVDILREQVRELQSLQEELNLSTDLTRISSSR
ncbi:MAG TPA: hypothetical protein VLA92_04625 [Candidatus Saccharimonadales bacterium]|nr:hypothetical protein [Candidatus Saccharimonadales bacterium]